MVIFSPYGRKLNLLETLAVVIDNMAQSPAMDLVNTDMGKVVAIVKELL